MMSDKESPAAFDVILASSVHDMKNSINMLTSSLEEVLTQAKGQETQALEKVAQMLYESRRVSNRLMQLLSIYKIDRSTYPVEIEPHDVAHFLYEVTLTSQALFESRGIEVAIDCEEALGWYFDRELVTSVVSAALNNAIRYTRGKIAIQARGTDGFLELRIEDNGSGFPPALLAAGTALEQGVKFSSGSSGLGLHFAATIARLHQEKDRSGSAMIENGGHLGGACFVLRLP